MRISVIGLWHLGSVTAAYLAKKGFDVTGYDSDPAVIQKLSDGKAPLHEPGLDALIASGIQEGHLRFTDELARAVKDAAMVWITIDTPVQWDDKADIGYLRKHLDQLIKLVQPGASLVLSSQVPVGFCAEIQKMIDRRRAGDHIALCYSPENLRLGKALDVMENPDRIVVGLRRPEDKSRFEPLFSALSPRVVWMNVESAEMTKHAINAFLATSVVFANELAVLCESVGANAQDVAHGLLTESRIGPQAYLKPGSAFAGGTLARDVQFLIHLGKRYRLPNLLMASVLQSNRKHQNWIRQKISQRFKKIKGRTVSVFGLTYKPNTDTLRRSWAIELCRWLHGQGAHIQAFDPLVKELPKSLASMIALRATPSDAMRKSDCAVFTMNHASLHSIGMDDVRTMSIPFVLDPNGGLSKQFSGAGKDIDYRSVGYESKRHQRGK